MSTLLLIALLGVMVYSIRLAGFLLPHQWADHPLVARSAHAIPIAALAALTIGGIRVDTRSDWLQLAVVATAGLIALRTKQVGLSVLVGLALLWIVSYFVP